MAEILSQSQQQAMQHLWASQKIIRTAAAYRDANMMLAYNIIIL